MKKYILSALLIAGVSTSAAAEDYSYYSHDDLYKRQVQSGHNDYLSFSLGSFTSDLDKKAAMVSIGYQKNYPNGFGYGASIESSLSSSVTESSSGNDIELRYVALTPYINQEISLLRLDKYKTLKGYVRLGASVVKAEGNYAETNYGDYEIGAQYGAGIIFPYADYASLTLGVHHQDAIDITEVRGGLRFSF